MIWMISSGVLFVLSLVLIGAGLFWDRPGFRGRPERRCRRCSYDLSDAGEVPVKCTECGREHATEKSLRRVRRHKRVVALGLVLLVGLPAFVLAPMGVYYQRMPSWLLAELITVHGTDYTKPDSSPGMVLYARLMNAQEPPSHGEIVSIIETIAQGNIYAPAGSERWIETSGAWIGGQAFRFKAPGGGWQYPDGTPGDEALNDAFEKLSQVLPPWNPSTRGVWPAGAEVTIYSGFKRPVWPVEGDLNERAILRIEGREDIVVDGFISYFSIEPIGEQGDRIEAELELSLFREHVWNRTPEAVPAKTERFSIGWTVASGVDKVLETTDSAQIRDAMIALVVPSIARVLDDPGFLDDWLSPEFDRIAFAIEAEIFDGDESLGKSQHWWMAKDGEWVTRTTSAQGTTMDQYNAFGARSIEARDKGTLRVVIRGMPEQALRITEAETAWDGEVDVLYSDAVKSQEQWEAEPAQEKAPPESTGP
tara:strand:+ start:52819 stop:54255 length:1437 start_codon:yes stop_codon:yes gene_type:complete